MRKIIFVIVTFVIAACAVLLLLLICGVFWKAAPTAGPIKVAVAFSGFTNDMTGSRLAAFSVSNLGGVGLFRWPFYAIEESGGPSPVSPGSCGRGALLAPGQSSICLLPAPTNNIPWRAVLNFSADNWRRKLAGLPPWVRGMLQAKSLSLPVTEGVSDWVGAVSATPAPPKYRERLAGIVVRLPAKLQQQTNGTAVKSPLGLSEIPSRTITRQQTNGTALRPPAQRQ